MSGCFTEPPERAPDGWSRRTRTGGSLPIASGDVRFLVDLDRGPVWDGKPLRVQVLRPGTDAPTVADVIETSSGELVDFTVPLDLADGDWVVLRVSDPAEPNEAPGPPGHPCNDRGVAYSSPWWLAPEPRPPTTGRHCRTATTVTPAVA